MVQVLPSSRAPQKGVFEISTPEKITAKQTISNFIESKQPGIAVSYSRTTLTKAAEDMFTANGLRCPILAIERNGETYLINRDIVNE